MLLPHSTLVILSLSAYALTFIIASSAIFEPLREWLKPKTPWLKIGNHKHMIECRMCMGFYCSLAVNMINYSQLNVLNILAVYGLSYFLATQER